MAHVISGQRKNKKNTSSKERAASLFSSLFSRINVLSIVLLLLLSTMAVQAQRERVDTKDLNRWNYQLLYGMRENSLTLYPQTITKILNRDGITRPELETRLKDLSQFTDTTWINESFIYAVDTLPVIVTLKGNGANWTGVLYIRINDALNTRVPLLENHSTGANKVVNVTELLRGLTPPIEIPLDTITFEYKTYAKNQKSILTGQNINVGPKAGANTSSRFTGPNNDPSHPFYTSTLNQDQGGHSFSLTGRMNESEVLFSFEDQATCKGGQNGCNYTDIIFKVSGLALAAEVFIGPPVFTPPSQSFPVSLPVSITGDPVNGIIYYSVNGGAFVPYTTSILVDRTSTIRAYQQHKTFSKVQSDTVTAVYTHAPSASSLNLTATGKGALTPTVILTEENKSFDLKVTVPYADTRFNSIVVQVKSGAETLNLTLTNPVVSATNTVYSVNVPLGVGATAVAGSSLETNWYDNATVTWTNPENPAEVLTGGFKTEPANKQATISFVTDATGTTKLTAAEQISGTATTVFVMVEDQELNPDSTYNVIISGIQGTSNNAKQDTVIVKMNPIPGKPGKFIASVSLTNSATAIADGILQAVVGDQLKAEYTDPVFGEKATVQIGYGTATQQGGKLVFTSDAAGNNELPDNSLWDLNKSPVYLKYTDDPINQPVTKTVIINVSNKKDDNNFYTDRDTFDMVNQGNGVWTVALPISDSKTMIAGNKALEIYFLGRMEAIVRSHKSSLATEVLDGAEVRANLQVAYPDVPSAVKINSVAPDVVIDRYSTAVEICVTDQPFSKTQIDTITASSVSCSGSKDVLANVKLVQKTAGSTEYCGTIVKSETTNGVNVLTCNETDKIVVKYTDPVSEEEVNKDTSWFYQVTTVVEVLDENGNVITGNPTEKATGNVFTVRVTTANPNITNSNDVITVWVRSNSGDSVLVTLTEVGVVNGASVFEGKVNFEFVKVVDGSNTVIESEIDENKQTNVGVISVDYKDKATGAIVKSGDITINSAFNKPIIARIEDKDGDGRADYIKVTFVNPLDPANLPQSITAIDWPGDGSNIKSTDNLSISIDPTDPNTLIIDMQDDDEQFAKNVTGIPLGGTPTLTLPNDIFFKGVKVPLVDNVKPVVVSATVTPGEGLDTSKVNGDGVVRWKAKPDTIEIILSEPIQPGSGATGEYWNDLFVFKGKDSDTAWIQLKFLEKPTDLTAPIRMRAIVVNTGAKPVNGSLIKFNPNAPYTDKSDDQNGVGGEKAPVVASEIKVKVMLSDFVSPVAGYDERKANAGLVQDISLVTSSNPYDKLNANGGVDKYVKPPYGVSSDGTQDLGLVDRCIDEGKYIQNVEYKNHCAPALMLWTKPGEKYVASVRIFDHLGTFITSFVYKVVCGEENDSDRINEFGLLGVPIFWNLTDHKGNKVGNGVYLWKVSFTDPDGTPSRFKSLVRKLGVARVDNAISRQECSIAVDAVGAGSHTR